ncbi:Uncharacterised protein [Mycobacteroides abscessus subsp. abscessus]|uniref:hypothetical protein n=1 Tax=Mycobacteroides abscessus TaxID=36809 RepID=UPI00092B77A2|nr:hypothetical protein [Mycobacteroides abscessus]MBE5451215.1 hypothetical protein [Mycobacteroides abscessus]SHW53244.1 Uncharacterised protein [Mycobacteroides abscessus subsp. abscessus]SHX58503.1 Uncharacterised protein [Mycobacteroides abscessus subsp. abscessus]SIE78401.1 Uncharacterised protein [Mycobacteroides abscessus subsp. abscessus]SII21648.1 Uncharacterised protein [Mycobacteroides abscessus subsp. abscessus]
MGKWIAAGLLGLSGVSLLSEYPLWGVGLLALSVLIVWMSLQGRQAARPVAHAHPTEWARARQGSAMEVARAERAARAAVRRAVKAADKRGQAAVQRASERVRQEQGS